MKQSRATSFLKSLVSTVVGFAIAMVANALVLPWFGYTPTLTENVVLTTIYTVISIARGYALERLFEALGWRARMSAFALAVLAERQRQITQEGWTPEHDDFEHLNGDLARHGALYAMHAYTADRAAPRGWRWDECWWKPVDPRRNLVKGAALIFAEGERHDRRRGRSRRAESGDWCASTRVGWPADHEPASLAHGKTRSQHGGSSA